MGAAVGPTRTPVELHDKEAAYATFPFVIKKGDIFILE
jgi:hypothetical protein